MINPQKTNKSRRVVVGVVVGESRGACIQSARPLPPTVDFPPRQQAPSLCARSNLLAKATAIKKKTTHQGGGIIEANYYCCYIETIDAGPFPTSGAATTDDDGAATDVAAFLLLLGRAPPRQ